MFRISFGAAAQAAALASSVLLPLSAATAATAAAAPDLACALPGELVSEDAVGDAALAAAPDPVPGHDVLSVHVAEPAADKLALTLTVDATPVATPNTVYYTYFTGDDGVPRYASYNPYPVPGEAAYEYGHTEPGPGGVGQLTKDGDGDASSTADPATGLITIVIPRERVLGESIELSGVYGDARALVGVLGTGLVSTVDSSPSGFYVIRGEACLPKAGASSAALAGGSLGFGLLAPLALLGLRRRTAIAAMLTLASGTALAADPASGTVSDTATELTYTFPVAPIANVSGLTGLATSTEAYECTEPQYPCDQFELTIALPAGYMETYPDALVRVAAATTEADLDIDLQVADESGAVKYVTRDNPPEQPTVRILPIDGTQKFIVQVTHGTPHTGGSVTVRLEPGDAAKAASTSMLGGAAGFGLLAALAGFGLLRRRGK